MNNILSTIPEKNIDFGKNYIEVSDNVFIGHKATLRIDKLSFTSEPKDRDLLINKLIKIKSNSKYDVKHYRSSGSIAKLYKKTITICSKKNKKISLTINYKPKFKQVNFIRFELSPQHIRCKQMAKLIDFLAQKRCLGNLIFMLLNRADVTRIDIALDLYGISSSNYYFGLDGATKGKLHLKDECHGFGGVSLGSYKSTVQIAVYDKVYIEKGNINDIKYNLYCHEELKFMRIEARIKPKGSSELMLSNLFMTERILNPFERLCIYPLSIKTQLLKYESFYNLLDKMTIPEALGKIEKGYAKDNIRKILKQKKTCLFDGNALWKQEKIKCMALLGGIVQPAYWNRKNWRRYMQNLFLKRDN